MAIASHTKVLLPSAERRAGKCRVLRGCSWENPWTLPGHFRLSRRLSNLCPKQAKTPGFRGFEVVPPVRIELTTPPLPKKKKIYLYNTLQHPQEPRKRGFSRLFTID